MHWVAAWDWLISNLCYQASEQVYLIKWPVSAHTHTHTIINNVFHILILVRWITHVSFLKKKARVTYYYCSVHELCCHIKCERRRFLYKTPSNLMVSILYLSVSYPSQFCIQTWCPACTWILDVWCRSELQLCYNQCWLIILSHLWWLLYAHSHSLLRKQTARRTAPPPSDDKWL